MDEIHRALGQFICAQNPYTNLSGEEGPPQKPRAVFIRMYGTCECEAPARQGKLKRIPYIRLGTALKLGR